MIKQGDITYIKFTRILRIVQSLILDEVRKVQKDFQPSDNLPVKENLTELVNTVIDFFSCPPYKEKCRVLIYESS